MKCKVDLLKMLLVALSLAVSFSARAAVSVNNFVPRTYTNAQGVLPYRLFIPTNYAAGGSFPLVLFLHGAGERGSDNRNQLVGQTGELVFASETNQLRNPSFMVAPQCPLNASWSDATRRAQVAGMMAALIAEFRIDTNRLYITGLSMGGYGTWDYIGRFPGFYAAAIPMNGGGTVSLAPAMTRIPIWNFHAANDGVVPVSESRTIVNAVRRAGGNVIYTEYTSGGHGIWTPAYANPRLMDWVYSQRLGAVSTRAPIVNILEPTSESVWASDGQPLALRGTATDGATGPNLVTWTNFTVNGAEVARGVGSGTTAWSVTNVALSITSTNRICVVGRGTSWYGPFGGSSTFNGTLQVIFPPVIVAEPQDTLVNEGMPVSLSVTSAPAGSAFTYRWLFNGNEIPGASAAIYTLPSAQYTNSGNYSVRVSNTFGSVRSVEAVLTVNRAPVLNCSNVVLSAGADCNANVVLGAGSYDPEGGPLVFEQTPSGPYPLGITRVRLTATDTNGASADCSVQVVVLDRTPPQIVCPADLVVTNAHDQASTVVTFQPQVADNCSGVGLPVCNPASGTAFGLGVHTVYCIVADGSGNNSQCAFTVTVLPGNLPPVPLIEVSPAARFPGYTNLFVISPNNVDATVNFDASASYDPDDAAFTYSWFEGDELFSTNAAAVRDLALGTHAVSLALDDTFPGGKSGTNAVVDVISAAEAVAIVVELVGNSRLALKHQRPLLASLEAAAASFDRGSFGSGVNQLRAFDNKVRAQVAPGDPALGGTLTGAVAEILQAFASGLR